MNTIQSNIDNLTALWQQASRPFNGCFGSAAFNYCHVEHSGWPNRLWFNQDITPELIKTAAAAIDDKSSAFTLPYWDIYNSGSFQILDTLGYQQKSEQIGMSLKLEQPFLQRPGLDYRRVTDDAAAQLWSDIFGQAFGYLISPEILMRTGNGIEYYLAYYQDQPAGTAMLYTTGDIAGIHAVGVIPGMRRKGIADDMMVFILNRAIALGASYATLQASAMGKGLYLKLGFKEEFRIKNYIFKV
ncbi:GNAT family N-acetyltransferase [Chitinophaga agrisoli]|uniref:GNAT family N-acetyltransferase n=1 Tax=Chitinophaga agrisoli TaxID=2607653 RepID=A0A5B2VKG0_9BACT|nr:GNAT family N-acetyltransferase [Chitinophaga agrisoli]KAA2239070.1 GNAT family N-acetyltransferase [Chitinophaga agrisoli]